MKLLKIKYLIFILILFANQLLYNCTCKATIEHTSGITNSTNQLIKIIPFKNGIQDTSLIKTIDKNLSVSDIYSCIEYPCNSNTNVIIDSVQIIYNSTNTQTHLANHIDTTNLTSPKKLTYNNKRNILNYLNYTNKKEIKKSKKTNCENSYSSSYYIFIEQDYIDAKK